MHHADGIILCSIENEWEMLKSYLSYGKLIACNEYNEDQSVSMIRAKQYEGFYKATEYLLSKEKRGIAYCTGRKGFSTKDTLELLRLKSRDNARTPMQWDASAEAGFTTGTPWFPVNQNYTELNYEAEEKDPDSLLWFYRKMVAVRRREDLEETFLYGTLIPEYETVSGVLAYRRQDEKNHILILTTSLADGMALPFADTIEEVLLNNYDTCEAGEETIRLQPYQCLVLKVKE